MDPLDAKTGLPEIYARAWYGATIDEFLRTELDAIVGRLSLAGSHDLQQTQREAWVQQVVILKDALAGLSGSIFFEFNIPRMGRRIDVVLLIGPRSFVVEFKVGRTDFDRAAIEQVWDYALDLKNFHEASHAVDRAGTRRYRSRVARRPELQTTIRCLAPVRARRRASWRPSWSRASDHARRSARCAGGAQAPYRPTPTIIEAARALYANHSVEAIARYDAGAENLRSTSRRIEELVDEAKR